MVGYQNTYIFILELVDNALNIFHRNRVDTGERLVEHYELRVYRQATGNLGAAAFASRKLVAEVAAHFLQTELCDKALELVALLLGCHGSHLEHRTYIVLNTELAEHRCLLGEIADAVLRTLIDRKFRDIEVVEKYAPFIWLHKPYGHIECRGLAGTVRPEQADNLSLGDIDGYMVGYSAFAIFFHQIVGAEHHPAVGIGTPSGIGIG